MTAVSNLHDPTGSDHPLKEGIPWRVFETSIEDITVLHADTFRRVSRVAGPSEDYNIQWKPTVIIQAGKHRLSFLDIGTLWRFTNAVIYPERYSFTDFKGIIEMFLPLEFFQAIVSESSHTISIKAQQNTHDEWIATGVEKYLTVLPNFEEIRALVQGVVTDYSDTFSWIEPTVTARFFNNDTSLFTWGRKEIEIKDFKVKFVVCTRYYHTSHIVQPMKAVEMKGSVATLSGETLVDLLTSCIEALYEANKVCYWLEQNDPNKFDYAPLTGTLPFKDRNRLEHERWLEISN